MWARHPCPWSIRYVYKYRSDVDFVAVYELTNGMTHSLTKYSWKRLSSVSSGVEGGQEVTSLAERDHGLVRAVFKNGLGEEIGRHARDDLDLRIVRCCLEG